jgi:hypothetical protein
MKASYIALIIFLFVTVGIFGLALGGAQWGNAQGNVLNQTLFWMQTNTSQNWGTLPIIGPPIAYFTGLWNIMTFSGSQFDYLNNGPSAYVKLIALSPIIGTVVFGIIVLFFQVFWKNLS